MWIPGSAAELEAALVGDGIEESAIFDGKRELSKNEDLAVDICAMTVEGGVLVYGAGESADKTRLTEPHPLSLAGRRERVSQVAQTAISEPPAIDVRALERDDSPGEGYLVVVVPQSARAPHQIVLKGKHQGRYYGRDATGNRILAQAEVELLYARRTRWEHDALEEADAALRRRSSAAYTGDPGRVFLLIGVKPLGSTRSFLINAGSANGGSEITALTRATETALAAFPGQGFSPDLHSLAGTWTRSDADHWTAAHVRRGKPELTMDVEHDGTATLFSRRVGDRLKGGHVVVFESAVAGLVTRALALSGRLCADAGYLGAIHAALLVRPLRGVHSMVWAQQHELERAYPTVEYRWSERFLATTIAEDPESGARRLVIDLTDALVGSGFDPFK